MEYKHIKHDTNGNARMAVHFLVFITDTEREQNSVYDLYEIALHKARKIGGKKFNNKQFGGGIVFQGSSILQLEKLIHSIL